MIPSTQLDRFLCAFANYWCAESCTEKGHRLDIERWLRMSKTFSRMAPASSLDTSALPYDALEWQVALQLIWECPEPRRVDFALNLIALYGSFLVAPNDKVNPPSLRKQIFDGLMVRGGWGDFRIGIWPDGFMQVLRRAVKVAPRMRRCRKPGCEHSYFLARRSSDVYCCKECSLWGKRKSNLKSWQKNWKRWPSSRWRAKGGRKKYPRKGK